MTSKFFNDPKAHNDTIQYWNSGCQIVGAFCYSYPKAAKKKRVLKKWIKRFGAEWGEAKCGKGGRPPEKT